MCLFQLYTHSELILLSQAKNELEIEAVLKPDMVFLKWVGFGGAQLVCL